MNKLFYGDNPPRHGEVAGPRSGTGGGGPRILKTPIKQVKRARVLRREMSLPEVLLWQQLLAVPEVTSSDASSPSAE